MRPKLLSSFILAFMAFSEVSCTTDSSIVEIPDGYVPVSVSVSGFSVSQDAISTTRATDIADYEKVKNLTLAFYKSDGTEVFKHTQVRENLAEGETFGEFSTSLPLGSYTMVVLANAGNNAISLTSPTLATYGNVNPVDTWAATQAVNIIGIETVNLSATLDRIVTALSVRSTDNRPAEVTHIRFTFAAGGKSFSPTTGYAISNTGFSTTIEYSASSVGTTTYVGGYLFLANDEQTMDVTIETLDAADGNVLFSKTISNVPLKRNRLTRLTGAIYSADVETSGLKLNPDWLTIHDITF